MDSKIFNYFLPFATLAFLFPPPYFSFSPYVEFILIKEDIGLTQLFVMLLGIFTLSIYLSKAIKIYTKLSSDAVRAVLFNLVEVILLIFFALWIVFVPHKDNVSLGMFFMLLATALVARYLPTFSPWKAIKVFLIFASILMSITSVYAVPEEVTTPEPIVLTAEDVANLEYEEVTTPVNTGSRILTQEEIDNSVPEGEPSTERKMAFGVADEPTILGSFVRMFSDTAEEERKKELYQKFPEFKSGKYDSDGAVMAGRKKIALLDVLLLLIIIFNLKLKERVTKYINKRR